MDPLKAFINVNRDMFVQLSSRELDTLHSYLFEILNDYIDFCDRNNLVYFLAGGTALGAVRHKGFIPWDDDVDVVMPREDYEKFKKSFLLEFSSKYSVEVPNSDNIGVCSYMKIKYKGTVLRELITNDDSPEIFIDVFPLDYCSKSKVKRAIDGWFYTLLRDIIYTILYADQYNKKIKANISRCSFVTRLELRVGHVIGKLLSIIPPHRWINFLDKHSRNNPSDSVTVPMGLHGYKGETFPSSYYFPGKEGIFEGKKIRLPSEIEKILTSFYGDYMTPPKESERAVHFFLEVNIMEKDQR